MKIIKVLNLRKIREYKKLWLAGIGIMAVGGVTLSVFLPDTATKMTAIVTTVGEKNLPIYCVETDEPKIAISFDAAWGADDTDELLQVLENNDVTTTFFLCEYWVDDYPEEVKKIAEAGHDIGNHSTTHPHMNQMTAEQITEEIQHCHDTVKELTGIEMNLFRPPFGEYNNTVIDTVYANGYYPVQWDVDSIKTKNKENKHKYYEI